MVAALGNPTGLEPEIELLFSALGHPKNIFG